MMYTQLLHLVTYSALASLLCFTTISNVALADNPCNDLDVRIAAAKQSARNMQFSRFSPENHPDGATYNAAVDEVVNYINKLDTAVDTIKNACVVIAASRAKKILSYAKQQQNNVGYATPLKENIDAIKECLGLPDLKGKTEQEIYDYESKAYYTCNDEKP